MRLRSGTSFTLVELLAVIAIMAVLISGAIFFTASYIQWAKQTTEKEIYAVLNDELTRYKSGGGNLSALTLGAPMSDIFAALQTPVVPAGMPATFSQQFMATGYTYPGRSLQAVGAGQQFHFYQVDQYVGQVVPTNVATTKNPNIGSGVGYMSNAGSSGGSGGYPGFSVVSTSGFYTCQDNGSNYIMASGSSLSLPPSTLVKFWASDSSGNSTGTIQIVNCASEYLTSLDVSGLSGLQTLACNNNSLTSINITSLTNLTAVVCYSNPSLTSLNLSTATVLNSLICYSCALTSVSLNTTNLTTVVCYSNSLSSLNVSGNPNLNTLICNNNNMTSLNITGDHSIGSLQDAAGNPSLVVTGP